VLPANKQSNWLSLGGAPNMAILFLDAAEVEKWNAGRDVSHDENV